MGLLTSYFKNIMPAISRTEREALESGTPGFESSLLAGKPDWHDLMDLPRPDLSEEEQAFMDGPVEELCAMLDDWKIRSETFDLTPETWDFIRRNKFFGIIIPKEYGGLGFSARAHSEIVMKIATRSATAAVTVMVPNSLGPAELLMHYGTDAQREHYLRRLASGDEIPCFALTEPNAGSDATSISAEGVVCRDEAGNLGIRLNWDKRYITLGPVATVIGMAFQLKDPDNLLGDKKDIGITLALIPRDTAGVTIGRRHRPMNIPFQNGPNQGKNVFIPMDCVIGGKDRVGQGWKMLVECLSVGRCISLPAMSVGGLKYAAAVSGAYSRIRSQFGLPIGKFEGIEESLARLAGNTYLADATRVATLQMLDRGEKPSVISAILKYHATEMSRRAVNDAMDIQGGKAISDGPNNLSLAPYTVTPVGITVEGANILTRNLIIFGQGFVRSHPFALKEMEAIDRGQDGPLAGLLVRHVLFATKNAALSLWTGMTNGRLTDTPAAHPDAKPYYRQINRLSRAFALAADATNASLMLNGDNLKRRERMSALLGDTMSHLYMAACALRHFDVQGCMSYDVPLMKWACERALYEAEDSLDQLLDNFPGKKSGWLLRQIVFPQGRKNKRPSHSLDHDVAKILLSKNLAREDLLSGMHVPANDHEPLAKLEKALAVATLIDYERKLWPDDPNTRRVAHLKKLTADIVKVDDFPQSWTPE